MTTATLSSDGSAIVRPSQAVSSAFSLVIPVYKNELNVGPLVDALVELNATLGLPLQVVFVVDGSPDRSGEMLLAAQKSLPFDSIVAFHSRNFGSFTAIRSGLELATGKYIAVMAADLQEPPQLMRSFLEVLRADRADIVFGQRVARDDSFFRDLMSNTFWWLYRKLVIPDVPKGGVDIFACTSVVRDVLVRFEEANSSLLAQLFWIGFRREFVPYERRKRELGESSWSISRRFRYMMDSIFSFTDLPIMMVLWLGVAGCIGSLGFGALVLAARLLGLIEVPGYTTIVILVLLLTSIMLTVQGIMGAYVWRTFENTKRRPMGIVGRVVEKPAAQAPVHEIDTVKVLET